MKRFNFKQMAVLAAVFMAGFASCDDGGEPEEVTDNVTVTITNLPNETNGMGGSVIVYTAARTVRGNRRRRGDSHVDERIGHACGRPAQRRIFLSGR